MNNIYRYISLYDKKILILIKVVFFSIQYIHIFESQIMVPKVLVSYFALLLVKYFKECNIFQY